MMNLLVREPGRPRLTWYGPAGERVELSGAVLENWVNKTVNLLVEEFDATPGTRVVVDIPAHWRSALWALGAWRCGATVVLPGAGTTAADVVVTSRPEAWAGTSADVVAVALPALARRFDGELPPGAIDAAAAVMTYADVIAWAPEADPDATALEAPGAAPLAFSDLLGGRPSTAQGGGAPRVLVHGDQPVDVVLRALLAAWAADGSGVLTSADAAATLRADPERLERLRATERITG